MFKAILMTTILLLSANDVSAQFRQEPKFAVQSFSVSGQVIGGAGQPVPGIIVHIQGPSTTYAATGENGSFFFGNLLSGNYSITFQAPETITISPAQLSVDVRSDVSGILATARLSPRLVEQLAKARRMIAEAVEVGQLAAEAAGVFTIPGTLGSVGALISGDPSTALPPGISVRGGTCFSLTVGGRTLMGSPMCSGGAGY
ncbi:MAG: carboxypeptidase regulatory-like domain-containing protein [Deltaproteobacteria bacterium]|nr:carboxypeptidase regulatory-like domain-containing protein [Deltaproteobacteria bacterium]